LNILSTCMQLGNQSPALREQDLYAHVANHDALYSCEGTKVCVSELRLAIQFTLIPHNPSLLRP